MRHGRRNAKQLLLLVICVAFGTTQAPALAQNAADLKALGIREISGKHIDLFTDLPSEAAIDELPQVFDAAVPLLEKYFALGKGALDDWRVKASVIRDSERFRRADLLPPDLPPFLHGFARKRDLWVNDQPSDYYRRHLLLHEGVHALMAEFLHGMGPPWYAEGMAELLATHHWKKGELKVNYFPKTREEVPEWGRVKVLRDAVAANAIPALDEIMAYDHRAHLVAPPYAWSWAACVFFESHPKYSKAFAELQKQTELDEVKFNATFAKAFHADKSLLAHEWQAFVSEADYGCDVERTYLQCVQAKPIDSKGLKLTLRVDRGWQSSGVLIESGKQYEIRVSGRYVIRTNPSKWESEPNGVTVHYHRGKPIGMILGAMLDESASPPATSPLLNGVAIGGGIDFLAKSSGVLYLKVNESAAELADNQGEFVVEVREKQK